MTKVSNKFLFGCARVHCALLLLSDKLEGKYANWSGHTGKLGKAQAGSGLLVGSMVVSTGAAQAAKCTNNETSQIVKLIDNGSAFIAALVAAASVLMLLWAAFLFITSGGSYGRAAKAKDSAKNVLIGFGLAAAIYIVRGVVLSIVGGVGGGNGGLQQCLKGGGKIG